jgi:hypothetical protein
MESSLRQPSLPRHVADRPWRAHQANLVNAPPTMLMQ